MEKEGFDWKKTAAVIFCAASALLAGWLVLRYLLSALLPFLVAAVIAAAVRPLAEKLTAKIRISERTASAVLVFILLAAVTLACSFGIRRLISELGRLASGISEEGNAVGEIISEIVNMTEGLGEKIALIFHHDNTGEAAAMGEKINQWLSGMFSNIINTISSRIPGIISSIIGALPGLLLALTVTVIASFYFALDRDRISDALSSLLPDGTRRLLPNIKKGAARTAANYLRAYSLILFMTFAEVFFGLSVLGVDYSFIIALITALVDFLPVFGVGTVLIPWAIACFLLRNISRGVGLLIIYAVVVVIRQFTEPKIVGGTLGIHPLLTLFAMYIGFRLLGVAGMIIGPVLVTAVRALMPMIPLRIPKNDEVVESFPGSKK
ncbi:MAG: sporulation integral membrane protein YtvI [Clostridia bacterium]|nr:sporulation integral membrane protein YtvI [Clostridia bacterium]